MHRPNLAIRGLNNSSRDHLSNFHFPLTHFKFHVSSRQCTNKIIVPPSMNHSVYSYTHTDHYLWRHEHDDFIRVHDRALIYGFLPTDCHCRGTLLVTRLCICTWKLLWNRRWSVTEVTPGWSISRWILNS